MLLQCGIKASGAAGRSKEQFLDGLVLGSGKELGGNRFLAVAPAGRWVGQKNSQVAADLFNGVRRPSLYDASTLRDQDEGPSMKFQLFKPRSALRDRATDVARSERLIGLLTSLIRECTLEEEGLLKRYESAQQNASWAVHRLEAEGGARELNAMIDSYEAAMRYCEKRVESLQRDKRLLASLHEALDRHRANSDFTDGSPPA